MNPEFRDGYRASSRPCARTGASGRASPPSPRPAATRCVDLDGAHPDVVARLVGGAQPGRRHASTASSTRSVDRAELSRAEFAVSGKVTRLTLRGETHAFGTPAGRHRVRGLRAADRRRGARRQPGRRPATVVVDGDATGMAGAARLVLTGTTPGGTPQSAVVTLDSVAAGSPAAGPRWCSPTALGHAVSTGPPRSCYGNVARRPTARRCTQVLGSGDARRAVPALRAHPGAAHVRAGRHARGRRRRRSRCGSTTCAGTSCPPSTAPGRATGSSSPATSRTAPVGRASATARAAPGPPSGSNNVRATLPQGHRRRRQRPAGQPEPAARPAARAQGGHQPGAGDRRGRPRGRGARPRLDPAPGAHARPRGLAARLRRLRARVRRDRARPTPPCCRCAAAARSWSPSPTTTATRRPSAPSPA